MKSLKSKILSIVIALMVSVSFCNSAILKADAATKVKLLTYKSVKYGFQFGYPSGWIQSAKYTGDTVGFSEPFKNVEDKYSETFTLSLQDISKIKSITLKAYCETITKVLSQITKGYKLVSKKEAKLDGGKAYKIIYTGVEGKVSTKYNQIIAIINKKIYTTTFAAEQKNYDKYTKTVDSIVKSIKVK